MKYWLNGAPLIIPEDNSDSGGMKYWLNGAPLIIVGNNLAGSEISVANKAWSTIKKIGGVIIAVIKKIGGVSPKKMKK
jgi:hypothetical protein